MDGSMNNIDYADNLDSVVRKHPFLAEIAVAVRVFLGQLADSATRFQASADANLGPLEEGLGEPLRLLKASILERAAQQKSDAIAPNCTDCGTKLIKRQQVSRQFTVGGGAINVKRSLGFCRRCDRSCCPADRALGLEGGYSPWCRRWPRFSSARCRWPRLPSPCAGRRGSPCLRPPWTALSSVWPKRRSGPASKPTRRPAAAAMPWPGKAWSKPRRP